MKNSIEYFYNFPNITIYEYKDKITFSYDNNEYHFIINNRNYNELEQLYNLTNNINVYYKIIKNKNNSIITNINNKEYILLRIEGDYKREITLKDIIITPNINKELYPELKRNNWSILLQNKIDFFIYQREHIKKKYLRIDEVLDYYIGMTENAISYFNEAINIKGTINELHITISHKRIKENNIYQIYNPLNIIIDHKARDISEYLKLLFVEKTYKEKEKFINYMLTNIKFNEYDYRLLIARMMYPSFFFDKYEEIVNKTNKEEEIIPILKRMKEYEEYLKKIYNIILKKIKIPKIEWIFK